LFTGPLLLQLQEHFGQVARERIDLIEKLFVIAAAFGPPLLTGVLANNIRKEVPWGPLVVKLVPKLLASRLIGEAVGQGRRDHRRHNILLFAQVEPFTGAHRWRELHHTRMRWVLDNLDLLLSNLTRPLMDIYGDQPLLRIVQALGDVQG
jgi:hypothetical protein